MVSVRFSTADGSTEIAVVGLAMVLERSKKSNRSETSVMGVIEGSDDVENITGTWFTWLKGGSWKWFPVLVSYHEKKSFFATGYLLQSLM